MKIFARASARVMVGAELAGDKWHSISLQYISAIIAAQMAVRLRYRTVFYPFAKYLVPEIKRMAKLRREAADFVKPVIDARYAAMDGTQVENRPEDAIQWLIDEHAAKGRTLSPDELVQSVFVVMVASIHSTAQIGLSILYDLLDHPSSLAEIRAEIAQVTSQRADLRSGIWTRQGLAELRVLDSFMRETLRVHSFTQGESSPRPNGHVVLRSIDTRLTQVPTVSVQRMAVVPFRFKDGLYIPAGTQVAFCSQQQNLDPDIHPDPTRFDPGRWLKKREEVDQHRFHFPSTTDDWLNWGSGTHAVGRDSSKDTSSDTSGTVSAATGRYVYEHSELTNRS